MFLDDVHSLLRLFASRCDDRATLDELSAVLESRARWRNAHALFQQIRRKNLAAEQSGRAELTVQYAFEELCAKTIYNLSGESAPFDPDAPYHIIPAALRLARAVGLEEAAVLEIVR